LSVLSTLAAALGMKASELLADEFDEEALILRKKDRQQIYNPDDRYIFYNLLTPGNMNADVLMILVHCEPHSETYAGEFHAHAKEEILYVLAGRLTVIFESVQFEICAGDTMRIPAHCKHRYLNDSAEIAELLTVKARG
jgi:quercetin dioxygenase-like cupin family protein